MKTGTFYTTTACTLGEKITSTSVGHCGPWPVCHGVQCAGLKPMFVELQLYDNTMQPQLQGCVVFVSITGRENG